MVMDETDGLGKLATNCGASVALRFRLSVRRRIVSQHFVSVVLFGRRNIVVVFLRRFVGC